MNLVAMVKKNKMAARQNISTSLKTAMAETTILTTECTVGLYANDLSVIDFECIISIFPLLCGVTVITVNPTLPSC